MICGGHLCEKELRGGFEQKDGTFRCAACVVHEIEMSTNLKSFQNIVDVCDAVIHGPKYSRPSRSHIKLIRSHAIAVIEIRKRSKNVTSP